jgi:hypothetical protein
MLQAEDNSKTLKVNMGLLCAWDVASKTTPKQGRESVDIGWFTFITQLLGTKQTQSHFTTPLCRYQSLGIYVPMMFHFFTDETLSTQTKNPTKKGWETSQDIIQKEKAE